MKRVLVVGITGAGKSTAARTLATTLRLPYVELDALAFGPGWTRPPDFVATVRASIAAPGWVVDSWGYAEVREAIWDAADTVVWLDFPRRVVLRRVLVRSLRRSLSRREIFGGNRETWRGWLQSDHPVWWSMREFANRRRDIRAMLARTSGLELLRITQPRGLRRWLDRLST